MSLFVADTPVATESNSLPQTSTHIFGSPTLVVLRPVSCIFQSISCTFDHLVAGTSGTCTTISFSPSENGRPFQEARPRKSSIKGSVVVWWRGLALELQCSRIKKEQSCMCDCSAYNLTSTVKHPP
ncbi:hypothetical protein AVEN_76152-1 [Araneus ventricosus]|uniref:Uncharacterized protein n=1 Tax=Araneus ventricosus TaxID=182803 RepID=A0A4Y2E5J7_ARAVE|nr:hypothetical protein AVEN_76152-1 [Araneus ventricosus]